jgi:hypothetical protein
MKCLNSGAFIENKADKVSPVWQPFYNKLFALLTAWATASGFALSSRSQQNSTIPDNLVRHTQKSKPRMRIPFFAQASMISNATSRVNKSSDVSQKLALDLNTDSSSSTVPIDYSPGPKGDFQFNL